MKDKEPTYKGTFDLILFGAVITLVAIGVVMVFSASFVIAQDKYNDSLYFFKKQLLAFSIGFILMLITSNVNYRYWKKISPFFLGTSILGLLLVFIPGLGRSAGGACRWIALGPLTFQPSEIAKLAMVIFIAAFLHKRQYVIKSFTPIILPSLLLTAIVASLVLVEPDLSTAVNIGILVFILLFTAGSNIFHLIMTGLGNLVMVILLILKEPYRIDRLRGYLYPWEDIQGKGYHIIQSLLAVSSGGAWGAGLGRSIQKYLYLPEQYTDFIFAIIAEELGFMGALSIILLFLVILWRGTRIALRAPDGFASLLAVGITAMIIVPTIINIGVVLNIFPTTGLTLPFISCGGSSLICNMLAVGILLNLSKYLTPESETEPKRRCQKSTRFKKFIRM